MAFKSIDSSEDVNSDHAISIFFVPFSSIHIFATVFPRCDRLLPRRTTCICRLFSLESAGNTERMKHNRKASFPISLFFAAKVQRKYETAKSLAEFLVFLFVCKLTQEHFFIHRLSTEFFLSTDLHRFAQIILISKDIMIITDYHHQSIIINQ